MTLFVVCVCVMGKASKKDGSVYIQKKWNMFYLQHVFNFQTQLGEKTISGFTVSTFVKQLYVPYNGWKMISSTLGAYHKESTL